MTNNDDPFELLHSARPSDRLRGARLARISPIACQRVAELRRFRAIESDTFVVAALDRAVSDIERSGGNTETGESWITTADTSDLNDVRAEAIQTVTRTVLHEFKPLVAGIFTASRDELGEAFANSATAMSIARLREFLTVVKRLWEASASPQWTEFDLADLISHEISVAGFVTDAIIATRSDPVIVKGDPALLSLGFQNVLRNAVEASTESATPVVVNCDANDRYAWVVVLDEGVGLPEASERVWEPGITKKSKDDHFGWGLSITQRAVHSIGGTVRLTPREHGGVACEIRWPLQQEGEEAREDTPS